MIKKKKDEHRDEVRHVYLIATPNLISYTLVWLQLYSRPSYFYPFDYSFFLLVLLFPSNSQYLPLPFSKRYFQFFIQLFKIMFYISYLWLHPTIVSDSFTNSKFPVIRVHTSYIQLRFWLYYYFEYIQWIFLFPKTAVMFLIISLEYYNIGKYLKFIRAMIQ